MEENLPWCRPSLLKQPASRPDQLEVESKFSSHRARRDVVGSAKCRKEIVEGYLVRDIVDRDRSSNARLSFRVSQVVRPDAKIEYGARLHTIDVVVVIFLSDLGERQ